MNKKLLVVSILAVFMLVAISYASAVSSNTTTDEQRESPLFRVRTRRAIGERLGELKEIIKAKFIGERVFFLPFLSLRDIYNRYSLYTEASSTYGCYTCDYSFCPTKC